MTDKVIKSDSRITLRYAVSLADGTVIEETGDTAETIQLGQGQFINELEQKLFGLKADETDDIIIPALENLFGEYDESRIQYVDHDVFDEGAPAEQGTVIEFTLPNGSTVPGVVREVTTEKVLVDFNHPLCGRDVMLSVDIVAVDNS